MANHAKDPTSGIEEFSSGVVVYQNSRYGRISGDPESTDPEGLITQYYLQSKPQGGFLVVESYLPHQTQVSALLFSFYNEKENFSTVSENMQVPNP